MPSCHAGAEATQRSGGCHERSAVPECCRIQQAESATEAVAPALAGTHRLVKQISYAAVTLLVAPAEDPAPRSAFDSPPPHAPPLSPRTVVLRL